MHVDFGIMKTQKRIPKDKRWNQNIPGALAGDKDTAKKKKTNKQ